MGNSLEKNHATDLSRKIYTNLRKKFSHLGITRDRSRNPDEQGENLSLFEDLPEDILNLVTDLLDPFDYLNFRSVSRRCRSVAPLEKCRALLKNDIVFPWLVLPKKRTRSISIVNPRFGRDLECHIRLLPPPRIPEDAQIRYSLNGRLIMTTENDLIEYNPLKKKVRTYNLHDSTVLHHTFLIIQSLKNITAYILYKRGKLMVVTEKELDDHNLVTEEIRLPLRDSYKETYLVSCDGEPLVVYVGKNGRLIDVFKLVRRSRRRSKWSAEEVKDLGNKCLFLSSRSSVSSEIPGMKNRIYLPRFYGKSMIYYSMETRQLHYSLLKNGTIVEKSLVNFWGADERYLHTACWLEPSKVVVR